MSPKHTGYVYGNICDLKKIKIAQGLLKKKNSPGFKKLHPTQQSLWGSFYSHWSRHQALSSQQPLGLA